MKVIEPSVTRRPPPCEMPAVVIRIAGVVPISAGLLQVGGCAYAGAKRYVPAGPIRPADLALAGYGVLASHCDRADAKTHHGYCLGYARPEPSHPIFSCSPQLAMPPTSTGRTGARLEPRKSTESGDAVPSCDRTLLRHLPAPPHDNASAGILPLASLPAVTWTIQGHAGTCGRTGQPDVAEHPRRHGSSPVWIACSRPAPVRALRGRPLVSPHWSHRRVAADDPWGV